MKRNQSGFTLIEIAIVLVIIGLLLGGVLKGQELINSARVKSIANDFKNIPVFVYGYQDRFRSLPGDDTRRANNIPDGTDCTPAAVGKCTLGNGLIDGNWNDGTIASETYLFWEHVRLANLAPGSTNTAATEYLPINAAGGVIGIQSGTTSATATPINGATNPIRGSYIICSSSILGRFVKQLDTQMDDGNTATGSMLAGTSTAAGTAMTALATASIDDAAPYTVCLGV